MTDAVREAIAVQARAAGFDTVGFAPPVLGGHVQSGLQGFLAQGYHGDMLWMEEKFDRRADPRTLWPEVQSVIVLGHNYAPQRDPMEKLLQRDTGVISSYALNKDYHDVIKKKLKQVARWLVATYGCEVKVFVDTAPVMEKPLAEASGIGWQGKHTCLVSREFGSWLFLGSIFTTLPLPPSPPAGEGRGGGATDRNSINKMSSLPQGERGHDACGSCTRCLDICPTRAFTAERQLDARRCISYLTIEHKGQIPLEFRKAIGNRIYGCDDCLAVCPWNKFAQDAQETAYHPREALQAPLLRDLARLDDAAFRQLFAQSPVKRIGRDRFVRNVLAAIGNSGEPALREVARALCADASPLVGEMAMWALGELEKTPI